MAALTVDQIIRRIEDHLTLDNEFDPANNVGDDFIVWSGVPSSRPGSRGNADHIIIRDIEWDDGAGRAHLLPVDRDRLVAQLRSTADFSWSQAADARRVLITSGLIDANDVERS